MNPLKKLAGQTAIYGMSSIVGRLLNYLLTPLYTYQFIAREFGVVTEMYAYVAFLVILLTYGMETAFFRFVANASDKVKVYSTALIPVFTTGVIFMTLCAAFAPSLAEVISYPEHPEYIVWFAIIVSLDAISSIPMALLRHENRAARFAWVNLTSIGVNIGLNLFFIAYCKVHYDRGSANALIKACYSPEVGVGYIFIANLMASVVKLLLLSGELVRARLHIYWSDLRKMLIYALPLLVAGLAGIANENLDRLLLKYLLIGELGPEETMTKVGIYGACYKISILITLFIQAYRYAAEPFFFDRSADRDAPKLYAGMMKYFVLISLLLFLWIMVNIDWVILFVGEEYRVGAPIVPILLVANIFLGIYYNLSVWYKLTDKTIYAAYIAFIGAVVTISLNVILIPKLGYMGSAWATLCCYSSMAVISYFLGRKHYPIPYPVVRIGGYALAMALVYLALSRIEIAGMTSKLIWGNLAFAGFVAVIYLLERPKKSLI